LCIKNLISEDESRDKYLLARVESITTGRVKLPRNVLPGETCQWNDNVQIIEDKPVIEISKAQERLNVLDFLRLQLVLNNLYFVVRHSKARRGEDVSQILYQLRVEFAFLCFGIKTSLVEMLGHFFYMPVMFGHVI